MFLQAHILRTRGDALHGSSFRSQEKLILSRQKVSLPRLYFLAQWLNVTLASQISGGCNGLKTGPSPIYREKGRLHFSRSAFLCAWELAVSSLRNGLKNGPSPIQNNRNSRAGFFFFCNFGVWLKWHSSIG